MNEDDLRLLSGRELLREICRQASFAENVRCDIQLHNPFNQSLIEFGDFIVLPRFPDKTDRLCPCCGAKNSHVTKSCHREKHPALTPR